MVPCFTGDTHGGLWGAWCCWECLSSKDMVCTGGKNRGPSTNSGAAIRLQTSWTGQEQGHGPRWHRGAKTCVREARPTRALNHPGCHFVTPWASPRLFFFFSLQSDFFFFFTSMAKKFPAPWSRKGTCLRPLSQNSSLWPGPSSPQSPPGHVQLGEQPCTSEVLTAQPFQASRTPAMCSAPLKLAST